MKGQHLRLEHEHEIRDLLLQGHIIMAVVHTRRTLSCDLKTAVTFVRGFPEYAEAARIDEERLKEADDD